MLSQRHGCFSGLFLRHIKPTIVHNMLHRTEPKAGIQILQQQISNRQEQWQQRQLQVMQLCLASCSSRWSVPEACPRRIRTGECTECHLPNWPPRCNHTELSTGIHGSYEHCVCIRVTCFLTGLYATLMPATECNVHSCWLCTWGRTPVCIFVSARSLN